MRQTRRRWRLKSGALLILVLAAVAIVGGIYCGKYVTTLLAARKAATDTPTGTNGTSGTDTGNPATPGGSTNPGGTTAQGSGQPTVTEVAFKLPDVAIFAVQAGRFDSQENAAKLVSTLGKASYAAWNNPAPPYRVYVGAFADKKNATALATKLKAEQKDCASAWPTSIAAPFIDKTLSGTDGKMLTATAAGLQAVAEVINREAALWDARATGTFKAADATGLADAYREKLKSALTDLRSTTGGDTVLRDAVLNVIVLAQSNLADLTAFASSGEAARANAATVSLLRLTEAYADAVVLLTPLGGQ